MSEDRIRDEELDGGLGEAFRRVEGESVLDAIERVHGVGSSVVLRSGIEDPSPINLTPNDDGLIQDDDRYQVHGEIARGGIGVIFQGRDKGLNREIALKVLRPEYADREDVVQRFVEEAQVGGQLQHPGIVPVYGIGLQPDGRPSFAMKLIKGQTLADLLLDNSRGIDLISVFEQIAQTMAYAHSRGVIHRDLKPANIMVGAFGEVQVVDWGFAKVLGREEAAVRPMQTIVATVRSGPDGSQSILGDVMGTPGYMPPEQALGRIDDLDQRSDVFALGAILFELLTGDAPYTGRPQDQLVAAAQCRLDKAFEKLDATAAADELKQLVRDCLAALGGDRPSDAAVVAQRLSEHLAGVEERARASELAALAASAEIARQRAGRRRAIVLASVVLVAVLVGGGVYLWRSGETEAREAGAAARIAKAFQEASIHEGNRNWDAAVASAQSAVDVAASEGVDDAAARTLLERLQRLKEEAEAKATIDAEDDAFLAELEEIRGRQGQVLEGEDEAPALDGFATLLGGVDPGAPSPLVSLDAEALGTGGIQDAAGTDAAYTEAFERFESLDASAERLARSRHAAAFAANLGFWYSLRRDALPGSDWKAIDALARRIDPTNGDLRDALVALDADAVLEFVAKRGDELPVALADQIGAVLVQRGRSAEAVAFLTRVFRRTPDDFWINVRLSVAARTQALSTVNASERAAGLARAKRHADAAIAIRPGQSTAWTALMWALVHQGDHRGAVPVARRLVELAPRSFDAVLQLGQRLAAARELDEAMRVLRRASSLDPTRPEAHEGVGGALQLKGEYADSLVPYRRAIELGAGDKAATLLAYSHMILGDPDAAKRVLRRAIEQFPQSAELHSTLGYAHTYSGEVEEGLEATRRSIELDPTSWQNRGSLARLLGQAGRSRAAAVEWRHLAEAHPKWATAHRGLVDALRSARDFDGVSAAVARANEIDEAFFDVFVERAKSLVEQAEFAGAAAACRQHLEGHPRDAAVHALLGLSLRKQQSPDAIAAYRRAVELEPENIDHIYGLADALLDAWELDETIAICQRVLRVNSWIIVAQAHEILGTAFARKGQTAAAIAEYRRSIELLPIVVSGYPRLAELLAASGDDDGARAVLDRLVRANPAKSSAHLSAGVVFLSMRDGDGAIAAIRRAIELEPSSGMAHAFLAFALATTGDHGGTEAAARRAVELAPTVGWMRGVLAEAFLRLGKFDSAIALHREAIELGSAGGVAVFSVHLARSRDFEGAIEVCRRGLELEPDNFLVRLALVNALSAAGFLDAAIVEGRRLVEQTPKRPDVLAMLLNLLVRAGDLDGGRAVARRMIELGRNKAADGHAWLAYLSSLDGDRAGAREEVRRAIESDPREPSGHVALGDWLVGEDEEGSLAAYDRAEKLFFQMDDLDVQNQLASALAATGDFDAALATWRRLLEVHDLRENPAFQIRRLERLIEIRSLVPRAIEGKKLAVSGEDRAFLARALAWKHEHTRAAEMFARAFEEDPELVSIGTHLEDAILVAIRAGGPWTERAIAWLREDVARHREKLAEDPLAVIRALARWRERKIGPIRAADDLPAEAKLLWAEFDAVIEEAKAQLKK